MIADTVRPVDTPKDDNQPADRGLNVVCVDELRPFCFLCGDTNQRVIVTDGVARLVECKHADSTDD